MLILPSNNFIFVFTINPSGVRPCTLISSTWDSSGDDTLSNMFEIVKDTDIGFERLAMSGFIISRDGGLEFKYD